MNEIQFYRASGEYGYMSNLYRLGDGMWFEDRKFPTSEHAYQFGKFRDPEVAEWAMQAPKPHLLAILAHNLFSWDIVPGWSKIKVDHMRLVVHAKFCQNLGLFKQLISTGDAVLIEDSKTDAFWGVGKNGTGKNMLGKILMEIREELKRLG